MLLFNISVRNFLLAGCAWMIFLVAVSSAGISQVRNGNAATNQEEDDSHRELIDDVGNYLQKVADNWNDPEQPDLNVFLTPYKGNFNLEPVEQKDAGDPKSLAEHYQQLKDQNVEDLGHLIFETPRVLELSDTTRIVTATWHLNRNQGVTSGEFIVGIQRDESNWAIVSDPATLGHSMILKKPAINYGWSSIIPPLLAIFLAIVTRRVLVSLFFGVFVGCGMLAGANGVMNLGDIGAWFISSLNVLCESFLWPILVEEEKQRILWFVVLMGGMVGIIHRSGGMHGIVDKLTPFTKTRIGGQFVTWLLGLIIFFDDYANTLLLGNTMRPVTDRLKISREKLAYIVDSTAAPVAGLAVISTWVAMLISQVDTGFTNLNDELTNPIVYNSFNVVVQSIPYRFYVIFAIVFVVFIALLGRDFGPMLKAEQDAADGYVPDDTAELDEESNLPSRKWYNAVLPITVLVVFTVLFLMTTGRASVKEQDLELTFFNIFSNGDSYVALVYASMLGLFTAMLLPTMQKSMSPAQLFDAAWSGVKTVIPAMAILWLAWSLSALTSAENLGTQDYLSSLLTVEEQPEWCPTWLFVIYGNITSVIWLPTAIFILSAFVAFATGSSWGTMGIMAPMVIGVTYKLTMLQLGECPPNHPLMLAAIGSVIAGSIFGDHCSPISDTTVLSSQASSCNHIQHVRTQMPYAILVGIISILFGTLPVGILAYNESSFPIALTLTVTLAGGVISMLLFLLLFGRRITVGSQSAG